MKLYDDYRVKNTRICMLKLHLRILCDGESVVGTGKRDRKQLHVQGKSYCLSNHLTRCFVYTINNKIKITEIRKHNKSTARHIH